MSPFPSFFSPDFLTVAAAIGHGQQPLVNIRGSPPDRRLGVPSAREAAARDRERAVKLALDQHYDQWSADWRRSQQQAVTEAVEAERRRHVAEVSTGSAGQVSYRVTEAERRRHVAEVRTGSAGHM